MTRLSVFQRSICCTLAVLAALWLVGDCFAASVKRAASGSSLAKPFSPGAWQARITGNDASPTNLIAVDKTQQKLFLFERHSPLRLVNQFSCTTGKGDGDKLIEGDLKTPEGIYFVGRKLTSGLDYEKYGYEAYTLNYPNPVDRIRRKTGYGIWIHGRGVPITPYLTEGCVSLNNTDIAMLGKNLRPGVPVALATGVNFTPQTPEDEAAIIRSLHKKTYDWAKAWSSKSKTFFDYYDAEAYSIAQGQSFSAFRAQKERVFKHVKRIDIKVENLQALQGPGYWVTWFQQDYRASNLSSKGVRRLYWQRDNKGELRIVGMEWAPHLSGTLTAGLSGAPVTDTGVITAGSSNGKPIAVAVAQEKAPKPEASKTIPARVEPIQAETAPLDATKDAKPIPEKAPAKGDVTAMATQGVKEKAPDTLSREQKQTDISSVASFVEAWRSAWEKGDLEAYAACYSRDAAQGSRAGRNAIRQHKSGLWKRSRPSHVTLTNMRITNKPGNTVVVDMHQSYTDSRSFADVGVKTLYLKLTNNVWQITREDWSPIQQ